MSCLPQPSEHAKGVAACGPLQLTAAAELTSMVAHGGAAPNKKSAVDSGVASNPLPTAPTQPVRRTSQTDQLPTPVPHIHPTSDRPTPIAGATHTSHGPPAPRSRPAQNSVWLHVPALLRVAHNTHNLGAPERSSVKTTALEAHS